MKKRLAVLLSLIFVLNFLPAQVLFAVGLPDAAFQEMKGKIVQENNLLNYVPTTQNNPNSQPDADEVTLRWNINKLGRYVLTYYTDEIAIDDDDDQEGTTKVEAIFNVRGDSVNYEVRLDKTYKGETPNRTSTAAVGVVSGTDLTNGYISFNQGGVNFKMIVNLRDRTVYFGTTGITIGNFTEFALKYGTDTDYVGVLKGLKNTSIKPTHYAKDATTLEQNNQTGSKDRLYITPTETEGEVKETAGSRPGIKVQFQLPKVYNEETKHFETVESSDIVATVDLWPQLEIASSADSGNNATIDIPLNGPKVAGEEINKPVTLQNNEFINNNTGNSYNAKLKTDEKGETIASIYLSADNDVPGLKDYLMKWPQLQSSMFVGGNVRITGLWDRPEYHYEGKINPVDGKGSARIDFTTGVTYLDYEIIKSEEGKVTLEIKPYKYLNQRLYYKIYEASVSSTTVDGVPNFDNSSINASDLIATYPYTYTGDSNNEPIYVTVQGNGQKMYVVRFGFSERDEQYESQRLIFDSSGMISTPPPATITRVDKQYVVVEEEVGTQVDAAGFDMYWTIPGEEELINILNKAGDNARLYYEVRISKDTTSEGGILCIVEVKLNPDGTLNLKINENDPNYVNPKYLGDIETALIVPADVGSSQTLLQLKNVVLKNIDEDAVQYQYNGAGDYLEGTEYPAQSAFSPKTAANGRIDFYLDNTYYLRVRTVLKPGVAGEKLQTNMYTTAPYGITLGKVDKEVPIPVDGLTLEPIYDQNSSTEARYTDYRVSFTNVKLEDYIYYKMKPRKEILITSEGNREDNGTPTDYKDDNTIESRTYEIYLYQDEYLDENRNPQKRELTDKQLDNADLFYEVDLPLYSADNSEALQVNLNNNKEIIEALRSGKIVKVNYQTIGGNNVVKLDFLGLDTNQSYNARVRTRVDYYERDNGNNKRGERKVDYSKLSKVIGITTGTSPKPPTDDENRPPAPIDYTATAKDSYTGVLNWNDPEFAYQDKLTYDIVRVTGEPLSDEVVSQGFNFNLNDFVAQTGRSDATTFTKVYEDKVSRPDSNGTMQAIYELEDKSLKPNTIYYYYIRTNFNGRYSQWLMQSVTTSNVSRPEELKAITSTINSIDISFIARVPMGQVPSNYDFEIMVQEENGEWRVANTTKLKENQDNVKENYTYFEYRINGLKPNKRYNIKVCLIDKTSGEQQKSLYTDAIYMRTMYDQDTQDKEDKYEHYLKRFDMEVEKLKTRPYWIIEEGTYKYREKYLVPEFGSSKNYMLVSEPNATEGYYYIPADAITAANDNQVILEAKFGNVSVGIRPDTLTVDNETIKEAIQRMNTNYIGDYYIGLRVSQVEYTNKINGEDPVSPKVTVELEVVQSKIEEWEFEENIMTELVDIIAKERNNFLDKLKARIDRTHISDEDLDELIEESIADIESSHQRKLESVVDKAVSRVEPIVQLTKAVMITISQLEDATVTGYYQNGNLWTEVTSYPTGDGIIIEATLLGSYIAAGQASLIDTIPGLAPYQSFISKYGLGSIFTLENETNVKEPVTKKQVYASTAKVLGAANDTDYATFLKNKGINGVALLTQDNDGRQDEIIYMVMQAYEVLKNKKVNQVRITNKQAVTNIGAFQPAYRDYVYAAVELKIIDNPDNRVLPSSKITQEDYIKILYRMTQR